jgi:hypothetical protein
MPLKNEQIIRPTYQEQARGRRPLDVGPLARHHRLTKERAWTLSAENRVA